MSARIPVPDLPYRPRALPRTPRLALVGCGAISATHLEAYRDAGYAAVALHSRTPGARRGAARRVRGRARPQPEAPRGGPRHPATWTAAQTARPPLVGGVLIDPGANTMEPIIDHLQITVRDMKVALPFYDRLMPLLGFDPAKRSDAYVESHDLHVVEYVHPGLCFGINSPRASEATATVHRRRPGSLHHLAFRAESRAEVDRFHEELLAIGAAIVDGPRVFPEHVPAGYYAVFFKDPDGIKYEVVHY